MSGGGPASPWAKPRPSVWVPRPREDAEALAGELADAGIDALVAPVLDIRFHERPVDLADAAAVLFTSANGVRALARNSGRRDIKIYAVGVNTAAEAESQGYTDVETADGDVDALADYVSARTAPAQGKLLHVAGTERAGDLAALLSEKGFSVDRQVLYEAATAADLPDTVAEALRAQKLDGVALFSPRTARIVGDLITEAGLAEAANRVAAICMSKNVATAAKALPWRKIVVAPHPDRASVLQAASEALKPNESGSTGPLSTTDALPDSGGTMNDTANGQETGSEMALNAETVIDRFGGIRPMAQKLDIAVSTVQGWKARNHIPENRWQDIQDVAAREGVDLTPSESGEGTPRDGDRDETAAAETAETATADVSDSGPDEKTGPAPEPDAAPPPPVVQAVRRPSGTAWLALIVAIAAAGSVATQSYWRPGVDAALESHLSQFFGPPPKPAAAPADPAILNGLAELQKRLDAVEATAAEPAPAAPPADLDPALLTGELAPILDRLAALEDRAAVSQQSEPATVDLGPLSEAITALRQRVDAMDNRADGSLEAFRAELATFADQFDTLRAGIEGVSDRLAALEQRLGQIESASGGPAGAEAAMVLAVGQLSDLIAASEPFGGALSDIGALAPGDATITATLASLRPFEDQVIATRSQLTTDFAAIAALVDRAERVGGASDWVGETLAELRSLVSIRRVDDAPEAPAVSRAEAALARNDLPAAVDAVRPFSELDPAVADWVSRADKRVTVDAGLEALRAAALTRLQNAAAGG